MKEISIPKKRFVLAIFTRIGRRFLILSPICIWVAYYNRDKLNIALAVVVIRLLADALFRLYTDRMRLNAEKQSLQVHINSLMAGDKVMNFPFNDLHVQLEEYTGFKAFWFGSTVLEFQNKKRRGFRITPEYGFTSADLKQFYQWLKTETESEPTTTSDEIYCQKAG